MILCSQNRDQENHHSPPEGDRWAFYSSEDNAPIERSVVSTVDKIYEYAHIFTLPLFFDLSSYLKMFQKLEAN